MKPGNDIPYGCASSLTDSGPRVSRSTTSRRVASESAQNTLSRTAGSARRGTRALLQEPSREGCSMLNRFSSVSKKAT